MYEVCIFRPLFFLFLRKYQGLDAFRHFVIAVYHNMSIAILHNQPYITSIYQIILPIFKTASR
jgi:hypothetical protein